MKYLMPSTFRNFICLEGGYCCYNWNINVTAKEFYHIMLNLKEIPEEERPPGCGFDIVRNENDEIKDVFTKNCGEHCGFLIENKCFLHQEFGMEGKPEICQSYPFYAIRSPHITYINASLACPCSLKNLAEEQSLDAITPSDNVSKRLSLKADLRETSRVKISAIQSCSWEGFYFLQKKLFHPSATIDYIDRIWHSFKHSRNKHFTVEKIKEMCDVDAQRYAAPAAKEHLKAIALLLNTWGFQNDVELNLPISFFLDYHKIDIENIDDKAAECYHKIFSAHFAQLDPEINEVLERYFHLLLFSSEFYFSRSVLMALTMISLTMGMVKFLAIVTCGSHPEPIDKDKLIDAIFITEKFFFHSEVFAKLKKLNIAPGIAARPI